MRSVKDYPRVVRQGSVAVRVYRVRHASTMSGFVYSVAWVTADGRKMKQFADEGEAMDEARLKATQLAAGRIEGAEMSRGDRDELQAARAIAGDIPLLAALHEWKKARECSNGNLMLAAESWSMRNGTSLEHIDAKEAVRRFLAAKKAGGVDITASYNRILPKFLEVFGARSLHSISSRELTAWMERRYPHPVSRNTARCRVVTLWRWARKQGYLAREVLTEAEQTESAREPAGVIGTITHSSFSELLRFVQAKYPIYLPALVIAGFCGLRRAEIHNQMWEDIHLDRKFLRVSKAKRNTPAYRLVPLSDAAVKWLMLSTNRKGPMCANLALDRIREAGRHASFQLPENCFRHSFISHRIAQTGNVAETALEAGNSLTIIFRHYRELFAKEDGEAWFKISPAQKGGQG